MKWKAYIYTIQHLCKFLKLCEYNKAFFLKIYSENDIKPELKFI